MNRPKSIGQAHRIIVQMQGEIDRLEAESAAAYLAGVQDGLERYLTGEEEDYYLARHRAWSEQTALQRQEK